MNLLKYLAVACLISGSAFASVLTIDIKSLPMDLSFARVKGDGSRNLYLFCDLDCPHCQRTEKFLHNIDNVTIHTFVMPVASYHPDAPRKTNAIWCSKDKADAWQAWFETQTLPADTPDCSAPLKAIDEYAHSQNIYLPAIIFEDGTAYHAEDFIAATKTQEQLSNLLTKHSAPK